MRPFHALFPMLTLLLVVLPCGCSDDAVAGDDDTAPDDDDTAADDDVDDDDTTDPPVVTMTSSPAPDSAIPWDGCIQLFFEPEDFVPEELQVTVHDGGGTELDPFTGVGGANATVMPMHPWPPSDELTLTATWLGGEAELSFVVEDLDAPVGDPVDSGWALELTEAGACPGVESLNLLLPHDRYALVDVLGSDGQGGVDTRFSLAQEDILDQEPCLPTLDASASYEDPLVWIPDVGPLTVIDPYLGDVRAHWMGMVLSPDGEPPERVTAGLLFHADTIEESMGLETCDMAQDMGAPWCGRCPDDPAEECIYVYTRGVPTLERAAPIVELTEDDVIADPHCQ